MAVRSIRFVPFVAFVTILAACSGTVAPASTQPSPSPAASITPSAPPSSPLPEPSPSLSASPAAPSPSLTAEASQASTSSRPRPSIDSAELAAYLTASLSLFDVADESVAVTVTYVDPDSGPIEFGSYTLDPGDQLSHAVPPGAYRIGFRVASAAGKAPTCNVDVKDGAAITFFVASADAIAVTRTGYKPREPADLFVATSSLCKA